MVAAKDYTATSSSVGVSGDSSVFSNPFRAKEEQKPKGGLRFPTGRSLDKRSADETLVRQLYRDDVVVDEDETSGEEEKKVSAKLTKEEEELQARDLSVAQSAPAAAASQGVGFTPVI